jgi:DNA-binding response OmpR family regulator
MRAKILLLEDDINLAESIEDWLEEAGFEISLVHSSQKALDLAYSKSYDLLLFDVNVDSMSGFEVLKLLREAEVLTPAIFITARADVSSLSEGFEAGADDYIRKPFDLQELLIRIEAIIKRSFYHKNSNLINITESIQFDTSRLALYRNSEEITLSTKELELLKLFLKSKDRVLTHTEIYSALWEDEPKEQSLRTYIKNLRKILGKERILNVKSVGYKFA